MATGDWLQTRRHTHTGPAELGHRGQQIPLDQQSLVRLADAVSSSALVRAVALEEGGRPGEVADRLAAPRQLLAHESTGINGEYCQLSYLQRKS